MARRWLLSAAGWEQLLAPPTDERDMLRHYALDLTDLGVIRSRRTDATRLGFALQMLVLRHPGRVLGPREQLPPPLVAFVARQLGVDADSLREYRRRDATRRQHLVELMGLLGCRSFGQAVFQDLVLFLTPAAQLDPLAVAGEDHAVVADHRSAAQAREADRPLGARTDQPGTAVDAHLA